MTVRRLFPIVAVAMFVTFAKADKLELLPSTQSIPVGTRPHFTIRITNDSKTNVRFIDVRKNRRRDLRDTYYRLEVFDSRGKYVQVPVAISDPGPVNDDDYFVIPAGKSADIDLPDYPWFLEELRPGRYWAFVTYHHWEYPNGARSDVTSSRAAFVVIKKRR